MKTDLRIRILSAIKDVAATAWDACANPTALTAPAHGPSGVQCPGPSYNPFISHAFLHALEGSRSATAKTGWHPQHLVAETAERQIVGAAACYLKSHSRGEYVFD